VPQKHRNELTRGKNYLPLPGRRYWRGGPDVTLWSGASPKDASSQCVRAAPALGRRHLMVEHQIRFDDGAAYERMMGNWSRLAGDICLDWLGRARACDGSTSAAAAAPSPSCSSIDPPPNTHPMSALVRKRRFGRARYRLKSRQTADQKCLAKTRGGHRGGHMRLIFGAIVGRCSDGGWRLYR
jgi:hypothetical protein